VHVGEGNAPTTLHVVSLASGLKPVVKVNVTTITQAPTRLQFTPDGNRVVLIAEIAAQAKMPPRRALFFDLAGKQVAAIGPLHDLVFRPAKAGAWEFVTYFQVPAGPNVAHEVSLYEAASFRKVKTSRITASPSGIVTQPPMEIAFFTPDYSQIVAKVAGAYDRKRDVRLPDREKLWDFVAGKFVSDREISNLQSWADVRKIREKNASTPYLLMLNGTQKSFTWELLDPRNQRSTLADLAPSLKQFVFGSLRSQPAPDGKGLYFGLSVDPQWPTVFGRPENAPEVFHLFRLDLASKQSTLLGTLASPGQVIRWSAAGNRVAVLRLHQYWKLGHLELQVYELPSP
jgi:hypothetical protein